MSELSTIDLSGDGGVLKCIIEEGTGEDFPVAGCKVSLHYTGKLTNGTIFDSSHERGEPFEFDLGKGRVIKAFDKGVASMKKGEKCILTCAQQYAYGEGGSPPIIPPNSTLIFELELLYWKGEDLSPNNDGSIERFILEPSDKKRTPQDGACVKVILTGKYDGRIFEERQIEFTYGEGYDYDIIEGVEIAIGKMAVGETSKIKIQSKYAYGIKGNPNFSIPPNSNIEYAIKLIECEKITNDWKLTNEERLEQAKLYKEKGTNYFNKRNYELAIKIYQKALSKIESNVTLNDGEYKKLRIAAYSNIALCYQKLNDYFEGKKACKEVLRLDPDNIKAWYRRGQCNLAINEFQEALNDFQKVISLDAANKAALNQIQACKQKIQASNEKEKKLYSNMFTRLAAADKEPVNITDDDILTKCGEWSEEDACREADLAFERDNNIVMI